MSIIATIISGLIIGVLARAIKPGADSMGWIFTIILGIVGAMVGGFLASALGLSANGWAMSTVFSVIGAIIVLFIYEIVTGKRRLS